MGVLYDVLFKPIGRDGSSAMSVSDADLHHHHHHQSAPPPEWVLSERDGGPLVWRRYGLPPTPCRKRVEFLDAVQVHVFERDDDDDDDGGYQEDDGCQEDDGYQEDDEDDRLQLWTDDWSWDDDDGCPMTTATLYRQSDRRDDYPVLLAVSVTVLGMCVALAYLFAPVRWLFHQLLVD